MKNFLKYLLTASIVLLLIIAFGACKDIKDKINEATTTTITTDVVIPIDPLKHITLPYKIDFPFSESASYEITSNEQLKEYLNDITSLKALSLEMKVTAADPSNLLLKSTTVVIKEPADTHYFTFDVPANFPLQANSSHKITEDDTDFTTLNAILNNLGEIELTADGVLTYPLSKAELKLEFIIKVQAIISANL